MLAFFHKLFIFFLSENDDQQITEDDKSFFCFSTIPAIFLYFITKESQDTALCFFENLCRTPYWNQIIHFVKQILNRMTMIYLLPISARKLITLLIQLAENNKESDLKYKLIVDNIICRYITTYVRSPNMIFLNDAVTVLKTSCSIPTFIGREATQLVINSNLKQSIDTLFSAVKTDKETTRDFSLALNLIGSFTFITPRDLGLLFKSITSFIQFCKKPSTPIEISSNKEIVQKKKKIISANAPASNSDQKYFQLRTSFTDQTVSNVELAYTSPSDDLIDIINSIDISDWKYDTTEKFIDKLFQFQPFLIETQLKSTITPEILTDTSKVLKDIKENKQLLNSFLQMLSSSLFVL